MRSFVAVLKRRGRRHEHPRGVHDQHGVLERLGHCLNLQPRRAGGRQRAQIEKPFGAGVFGGRDRRADAGGGNGGRDGGTVYTERSVGDKIGFGALIESERDTGDDVRDVAVDGMRIKGTVNVVRVYDSFWIANASECTDHTDAVELLEEVVDDLTKTTEDLTEAMIDLIDAAEDIGRSSSTAFGSLEIKGRSPFTVEEEPAVEEDADAIGAEGSPGASPNAVVGLALVTKDDAHLLSEGLYTWEILEDDGARSSAFQRFMMNTTSADGSPHFTNVITRVVVIDIDPSKARFHGSSVAETSLKPHQH
ncbi:hypothetical protein HETIRDRAFT_425944 [Heterobasidion irregulare TC 32-1]|uniref:Uncharacterized protein n=1 Tax=Heterobasidion irregulare (strain TC 32-1) TaxID=747525 RepID=W4KH93_HETIT|nr:uncharacterized protein HETIRDRAFT_425944 [Heterobasidion irregulare TC 32-1]ETW84695.1 hypothetical protein HETIRDRAFT_425944 [Heterobasidion irregulare TC 32-1]